MAGQYPELGKETVEAAQSTGEISRESTSIQRVLLIEDNPDDALLLKKLIRRAKGTYEVEVASTMAAAIARIGAGGVDLVLLDLTLPDSHGIGTFLKLHSHIPDVPIIVMTGLDDEKLASKTVQEGAQDYLVKGQADSMLIEHAMRYAIQRTRAEAAFNRERNLLHALLDNIPDRIYFKDTQSRFIRINKAVSRLFNLNDPQQVVGKSDFDLFTFEHAQAAYKDEQEMIRTGQPLIGKVEKETWPDGHVTYVFTTKMPLRDSAGRIVGTMGISRDITARKLAEEKLEQANKELAQNREDLLKTYADLQKSHEELKSAQLQLIQAEKMQSVGRLAAGVAHEVKNPLAVLSMGITYLANAVVTEDENVKMVLSDMKNAVQRADTIIKGLLDFSVPKDLDLQPGDIHEVIDQSLSLVRHELANSSIKLEKEYGDKLPVVRVDKSKIEQVMVNVFLNAIHAMPEGGKMTIKTYAKVLEAGETTHDAGDRSGKKFREGADVLVLEVMDSGGGIAPDKLSKVFDPFFTTKPTGKGTGLGLTVTRKIIELHDGMIDIRNRSDGTSGVVVTIMFKV